MTSVDYCKLINKYLLTCFDSKDSSFSGLFESMSYSLNAGGKRIRAQLVLEFSRICGGDTSNTMPIAAAVEMLHAYSLIHDDLPCMDNDDFRRGKPTNHRVYGETTAVLAGDALQCEAFWQIMHSDLPVERSFLCAKILSEAAGPEGMCGGQYLDTIEDCSIKDCNYLNLVNRNKTGALISASCKMGVAAAGGTESQLQSAEKFGELVGLAFQIRDDVLDVIGSTEKLGKTTGSDEKDNKPTYMSLLGEAACMQMVNNLSEEAKRILAADFSDVTFLNDFVDSMIWRCN